MCLAGTGTCRQALAREHGLHDKAWMAISWLAYNVNGKNNHAQVHCCVEGHRSQRPRGGFEFQGRPDPEVYQHHMSRSCKATKAASVK